MRTATLTPVAVLATERGIGWTDNTEQGAVVYRPTGTPRKNDGIRQYWMIPGETYMLTWDQTGWVVTNQLWAADHTYRLGTEDGQGFARDVLTSEGVEMALDTTRRYAMRLVDGEAAVDGMAPPNTYATKLIELHEVH